MKYAIDYFYKDMQHFKYLDEVNEITIKFNPSDKTLIDFMEAHANQRINIYITNVSEFLQKKSLELFDEVRAQYPLLDFAFKLDAYTDEAKELVAQLREKQYKFYFNIHVKDFDTLHGLVNLGVSDVYITEELGFELEQCAKIAHERNVQIRVYPNIAQSSWSSTPDICKFFIRPDDVDFYEPYVDVMEFLGDHRKLATYYKIYAEDKKWLGKLNEVIIDFADDVDNQCILSTFANRRVDCGKRCLKGKSCQICATQQELAETLAKNHLTLKTLEAKPKRAN